MVSGRNGTGTTTNTPGDDVIPLTTDDEPDDDAVTPSRHALSIDDHHHNDVDLDAQGVVFATAGSSSNMSTQNAYQRSGSGGAGGAGGPSFRSMMTSTNPITTAPNSITASNTGSPPYQSSSPSITTVDDPWTYLQLRFAHLWQRVPASWSLERDPSIAFRHVMTLLGFISLCIFVFSVPYMLHLISPRAPTPPGTAPPLDEAASTVSGKRGAVAADVADCSKLGVKVLRDLSGNAVDAAIATVLCQGVLAPFASGLGGGAIALVHSKKSSDDVGVSRMYDAREAAPMKATMELYNAQNMSSVMYGGLAVAIPGELRGLYRMHIDFGKLPWKEVVMPVVEVAQSAKVGQFLAAKLKSMNDTILTSASLAKLFTKKVLTSKGKDQQDAAAAAELPGMRRDEVIEASAHLFGHKSTGDHSHKPATTSHNESKSVPFKDNDASSKASPTPSFSPGSDGKRGSATTQSGPTFAGVDNENDTETHVTQVLAEGDDLKNEALVQTLRSIALHGPDALYHNLSSVIAAEVQGAGGVLTSRDIRSYDVKIRAVVESNYQGFTILGASPPSSGGASIAMALNMITSLNFRKHGRNSVTFRLLVECLKWVFGAAMGLADPSFIPATDWQLRNMLSRREALRRALRIDEDRTYPPSRYAPGVSTSTLQSGTSHVSVVDANGTAVSISSSINLPFGARIASESTGFIYNDAMHAFTTDMTRASAFGLYPTSENSVEPGKRPTTAACPTIVLAGRHVYMSLGGSGGPKAITGVLQTMLNILDFGDSLADAISAPRIHHQLVPNVLELEAANGTTCTLTDHLKRPSDVTTGTLSSGWVYWASVCEALKDVGHRLDAPHLHSAVQAVLVPSAIKDDAELEEGEEEEGRTIYAASDHRRIGKAAAY